MKINIKDILQKETASVDFAMSKKLIDTPLQQSNKSNHDLTFEQETPKKQKRFSFKVALSCLCLALIAIFSISAMVFSPTNQASALTTYIIEINPSICITTDENDIVVSAYSLNNDGDNLLSDPALKSFKNEKIDQYLKQIINVSIDKGFIKHSEEPHQEIMFHVTNNKESFAKEKGNFAKEVFEQELKNKGFSNYDIKNKFLPVPDFKQKMGFDSKSKDLDKFHDKLVEHEIYFNPDFIPPILSIFPHGF